MKLKCERAALYEAVQLAGALASTKMAKPILQNVKMVAENKRLDVMATDLEVGIRFRLENVEIGRTGSAAVSASQSACRSQRARSAPSRASDSAMVRPMPREAPVTSATLPSSCPIAPRFSRSSPAWKIARSRPDRRAGQPRPS